MNKKHLASKWPINNFQNYFREVGACRVAFLHLLRLLHSSANLKGDRPAARGCGLQAAIVPALVATNSGEGGWAEGPAAILKKSGRTLRAAKGLLASYQHILIPTL